MSLCSNVVTMLSIRQPGLFGSSHRWIRGLRVSMTGVIRGSGTSVLLLLDLASDELDGVSLEEDSSYGGRMPASGGGS